MPLQLDAPKLHLTWVRGKVLRGHKIHPHHDIGYRSKALVPLPLISVSQISQTTNLNAVSMIVIIPFAVNQGYFGR